jgi:hypothetical protein
MQHARNMIVFEASYWATLSPLFRAAHNRLRQARGLLPIPEPKVDRYKPPQGSMRPIDPADPEADAAAREFLGPHSGVDLLNKADAKFLAWAKANDCTNEVYKRALAKTIDLCLRPRPLQKEFWRHWVRVLLGRGRRPRGWTVAREWLGASPRTIRRARHEYTPPPLPPPPTHECTRKMIIDSLDIAERSGNQPAIEFLRQQLRRLEG